MPGQLSPAALWLGRPTFPSRHGLNKRADPGQDSLRTLRPCRCEPDEIPQVRLLQILRRTDLQMPDEFAAALEQPIGIRELGAAVEAQVHVSSVDRHVAESLAQAAGEGESERYSIVAVVEQFRGLGSFREHECTQL